MDTDGDLGHVGEHSTDLKAGWERWRKALLAVSSARPPELHALPLARVEALPTGAPSSLGTYFARDVDRDVIRSREFVYVYAKLPGVAFIAPIAGSTPAAMVGTRVNPLGGELGTEYSIPRAVLEYMVGQATKVQLARAAMSDRQIQVAGARLKRRGERGTG